MKTLCKKDMEETTHKIEELTGKSAPDFEVALCGSREVFISAAFPDARGEIAHIPAYFKVKIDRAAGRIITCDEKNVNLYVLYLVNGCFNNIHPEWHAALSAWAERGFFRAEYTAGAIAKLPDILYNPGADENEKAELFAGISGHYGFSKMLEWNEKEDLLYYYNGVFGQPSEKHIETCDISFYESVLRGEQRAGANTELSLMIDEELKKGSSLEVFYSSRQLTKAAIKSGDRVLGFANITPEGIVSYVTDYIAWSRRRASGYAKNNPYDEKDFMAKALRYTQSKTLKILEIGVGTGRIAAPFVKAGFDYHGIDVLDGMLGELKEKLGGYENLHIKKHDIRSGLPYPDNEFDLVLESRAIYEIEKNAGIMSDIKRVLKPGGTAILGLSDNNELQSGKTVEYKYQSRLMWQVYKRAYFDCYNITDRPPRVQNINKIRPEPKNSKHEPPPCGYTPPEPAEIFTDKNPFSTCEYDFDLLEHMKDNIYHMAYFRLESMYEPCGTDFFREMKTTAHAAFRGKTVKCTRYTTAQVYKFD